VYFRSAEFMKPLRSRFSLVSGLAPEEVNRQANSRKKKHCKENKFDSLAHNIRMSFVTARNLSGIEDIEVTVESGHVKAALDYQWVAEVSPSVAGTIH
jgi:hypothetical protein